MPEEAQENIDIEPKDQSAHPTQLDMEEGQDDMEPEAKRAKLCWENEGREHKRETFYG